GKRLQDPVPVRRIAEADPHTNVLRRERADGLTNVEGDRLRARRNPGVDHFAVADDRDAGLSTGIRSEERRVGRARMVRGGRRHTRSKRDWSSDVCSSDLGKRLQDPVPVRRIAEADPHTNVLRRERADGLTNVEGDRLRARRNPGVDHFAVADDRDAGLSTGIYADSELRPFRLATQELEGFRSRRVDVVDGHDVPKVDTARLRGGRQNRAYSVRYAT